MMKSTFSKLIVTLALLLAPVVTWAQVSPLANTDLPKTFTFEEGTDYASWWTMANGSDGWYVGTATHSDGTQSLYISNDNGTSNAYSANNIYSYAWVSIDVQEAGEYEIAFDWKCYGESSYDYMYVYWAPASVTPTANASLSGATQIGNRFNQQTSWQHYYTTKVISDSDLGEYKLIFMWRSDVSGIYSDPAALDNIYIGKLTCPAPVNLVTVEPTNEGCTFSWSPIGDETAWNVYIGGEPYSGNPVTDTSVVLTGLEANTDYNLSVRAVCGEDDTSMAAVTTFRTLCQEGNCSLTFNVSQYSYCGTVNVIQNGDVLDNITFNYSSGTSKTIEICNGDSLILTYTAPSYIYSTTTWHVIDAGDTEIGTFTNSASTGDTVMAVANGCPSCIPPTAIHQTPTDPFSTTIHWTDNNVAGLGDYVLVINGTEYNVSGDSTYVLATYPLTHYDVTIARVCEGNDTSATRSLHFVAPCDESVYAQVPFYSGFEELEQNESPDCWVQVQVGGNPGLGSVFPSAYRWAPNAHTGSVYFEFESSVGNETEILALPRMEDVSTLQLSFYASTTTSTYLFTLEAGVVEIDDTGNYVFVPVDTINLDAGSSFSNSYHVYNVLFDTYEGNGERLALRTTPNPPNNSSIYTLMLDDFNVIRVGVPVLGPFEHSTYSVNMGDTLHLNANLMTGEVDTWTWSSEMLTTGEATIVNQDSSSVSIIYNAAGIDTLTVTASNANGYATKSVVVSVIDNSLISEYPYSTGFEPGQDRSWYLDGDLNGWAIGTAAAYEDEYGLYISRDNGVSNVMADGLTCRSYAYRQFDMGNGGEYEVSFYWKGNGASGSRYMNVYLAPGEVAPTHGNSPSSSWTLITTCNAAANWTEFSDVVEAQAGVNTLIFYWYGTGNVNPPHAVDNIVINKLNCSRVGNLTASNIFAHSADITWTPRNDETSWYVQVDSADGYTVSDTLLNLSGFAGESHHTVAVRALCADGDTSAVRTVSFTTTISCPAVTNIHTTEVSGTSATIAWTAGGEETAWKVCVDGGDTVDVADSASYTVTGLLPMTNHTIMVMANCGDEDGQSVPANYTFHTLCDDGTCDIAFHLTDSYSGMDGWNGGAIRVVQNGVEVGSATIPNGSNAAEVNIAVCSSMPASLVFTAGSYPNEMGGTVETQDGMVIYNISGMTSGMNGDTLATVDNPCPTCFPATNIVIDTFDANSITLTWQPTGANTFWAVYANGELVSATVTDTTYTFTGLDANTLYTLGVRAVCEDNDSSAVRTVSLRTMCAGGNCEFSIVMSDSYGDGWNGNAIEVYQNGSLLQSYTISSGSSNSALVSTCLGDPVTLLWHTGSYPQEASFEVKDAADSVLLSSGAMTGHSTGDSIMTFDGNCNATVIMTPGSNPGSDCAVPTGLTVTATDSTVTVSFTGHGYVDGYEVEIVEGSWSGSMGEEEFIDSTSYTFTGLTPGTDYTVAVRTVCDEFDDEVSDWVTITVTTTNTEVECYAPTALTTVSVDSNRATITWTPGGTETQWQIRLNNDDANLIMANSSTYTLNNLTPNTEYRVRVRAYCAANNQSGWSAELTFTTSNQGIALVDGLQASLYPNPASSTVVIETAEAAEVAIIDLNGREVFRSDKASTQHRVDVSAMARGAYFVRITSTEGTAVRKLILK